MTNRKIIAGLLAGIAAAVTISIILSSKKGKEASKKFLKEGNTFKEDLKGKFNDFVDQVQDKVHGILK
jgi:gas vesicle protein